MLSIIKNIIGEVKIYLNISNWSFSRRENSPDNRQYTQTNITINKLKIESFKQQNISADIEKILSPDKKEEQSIDKLRKPLSLLPSSLSNSLVDIVEKEETGKKEVNERIDEAVSLMKLERYDDARVILLTLLGEIKNKQTFLKEQARIYNNLGVTYNRPKPEGDYDKAIEYFNDALEKDTSLTKAKMNIASAYLNKNKKDSIEKGYDLIRVLWDSEKNAYVLHILLWGIYKSQSSEEVFRFIEKNSKDSEKLIEKTDILLNLLATLHLESGNAEEALNYTEKALAISPNEPEFVETKARALLLKTQTDHLIPSEFDITPRFNDYKNVREALKLFTEAEKTAEAQRKLYLLTEIRYGISTCLTWLGRYDESKYRIKQLEETPNLPELLAHKVNVYNFAIHLHNRDFETAYNSLVKSESYPKITYEEKRRVCRVFLSNGAPEQAKSLLDEIVLEAESRNDIYYWFYLSAACVLLGNQQQAISAATKAKHLSENMDIETRKKALSHYNAINYRYSLPEDGENSETGRLISGMQEFQKEFPSEKILTPIKAIDEDGQLTSEIKEIFSSAKKRYENVKKTFRNNPIPIYFIEKTFHKSFAEEISFRGDPEFTIEFTSVDPTTLKELTSNFSKATSFVFDYLSLLDLAKMDFLGFLERLDKPIFVHERLFEKVQNELLQNEIKELRVLWNFLRKSKVIQIIRDEPEKELKSKKLDKLFDDWLIKTIVYAKDTKATLVTSDFRLYRLLKSEEIKPLNIVPILSNWLKQELIDDKMYSRALGDLAERFYVFLSYRGEDLFEIVLEDKGKITPRSYHLAKEVFLPGSDLESFARVFARFIQLFWRTGSLPQEKVNWIKFLTNIITDIIDKDFTELRESKISSKEEADALASKINEKLKPAILSLGSMWKTATESGSKDDLRELLKVADEVLNKEYLKRSIDMIKSKIKEKLK